jgi:(2Fe-2S) ferredoxin
MGNSLNPDVKFILHGKFKNTMEEAKDWRPISVAATLKDFLRRKELNRKVSVETIHCNSKDGLDVLVLPGKVRYTNMVPENVPEMVARHVDRISENETGEELLENEG